MDPYVLAGDIRTQSNTEPPKAAFPWLDAAQERELQRDGVTQKSCNDLADKKSQISEFLYDPLEFEKLLLDLTAAFVDLPTHEIDAQIENGLRRLGEFLGIDRSSFAEFSEHKPDMIVTHCYVAPGILPFPRVIVDGMLPWYSAQIRQGDAIRLARLPEDAPPEAAKEREYCIREGLKSNLAIPLKVGGVLRCVITFATFRTYRNWPDDVVQRLWLIGEIFAASLARKRAEEQTQNLRDQLARMGRVTLVAELAASIAHEISQPLCAIVSNAQAGQRMLSGNNVDLEEVRETLVDIAADSRRASAVVERVRAMLQKQTVERAPLQLNDAICDVVSLIRKQSIQKGITVSLDLQTDLALVYGDRVQLQQVMLNLALNAIDAMSGAGIVIRNLIIRTQQNEAQRVMVSVCDTGPGIEPEHLEAVFNAFFTTKPTGIGVGLAISRSIIEAHNGRMWVNSEPGRGTMFHFTLPVENGTY